MGGAILLYWAICPRLAHVRNGTVPVLAMYLGLHVFCDDQARRSLRVWLVISSAVVVVFDELFQRRRPPGQHGSDHQRRAVETSLNPDGEGPWISQCVHILNDPNPSRDLTTKSARIGKTLKPTEKDNRGTHKIDRPGKAEDTSDGTPEEALDADDELSDEEAGGDNEPAVEH